MNARRTILFIGLVILLAVGLVACGAGEPELGTAENPIVMSFVPSGDTQDIIASGDTLATMLTEMTGLTVTANVGTDFSSVREAMCAGQAHIGWLNTFNYVLANEQCGVDAAMATSRFGASTYAGQIIVRADSGIETLADLNGKVMCWVDPASTSGYIIPRIMLAAEGIDPDTAFSQTIEAGSHNNVVTQVYNGDCDAGATFADARTGIEEEFPDVLEQVVVLATKMCIRDRLILDLMMPEMDGWEAVSYTHLDVYKRQVFYSCITRHNVNYITV